MLLRLPDQEMVLWGELHRQDVSKHLAYALTKLCTASVKVSHRSQHAHAKQQEQRQRATYNRCSPASPIRVTQPLPQGLSLIGTLWYGI